MVRLSASARKGISQIVAEVLLIVIIVSLLSGIYLVTRRYEISKLAKLDIVSIEPVPNSRNEIKIKGYVFTKTTCKLRGASLIAIYDDTTTDHLLPIYTTLSNEFEGGKQYPFEGIYQIPSQSGKTVSDIVAVLYRVTMDCDGSVYGTSDGVFVGS